MMACRCRFLPGIASAVALALAMLGGPARAHVVALAGVLGDKAVLVIDGAAPKTLAVGQSHRGVTLRAVGGQSAEVEVGGTRQTLRLGAAALQLEPSAGARREDERIVLHAVSNGHFATQGQINGGTVRFMVDTGATYVAIGAPDAQRLGISLDGATPLVLGTANGVTQAWRVKLNSVRIADVTVYEVDAVVTPTPMPYVLLGNSYLARFQMSRTNDQLVLQRRY
jgi:aspartyl protease family protein